MRKILNQLEKHLTEKKKRAKKNSGITIRVDGVQNKEIANVLLRAIDSQLECLRYLMNPSLEKEFAVLKNIQENLKKTT